VSGELSANYALAEQQRLSAGIQLLQDNVEAGSRATTFDGEVHLLEGRDTVINTGSSFLPRVFDIRHNFGSYLQYALNTQLLGKTNMTLGLRYDRNSYFGDALSPRVVIVNRPSDKVTFKVQYGRAFRSPTNLEIYQAGRNFELTTEKIRTYEINISYSFTRSLTLQLNGFHNELTDVIILGNLTGLNPDKNPGELSIRGLEASLTKNLDKTFSGFMNFTWQQGRGRDVNTNASGKIPGIASVKGNAGVTAEAADLFSVSLALNWVGRRQAQSTNPYGWVPGYTLTNLAFTTKPLFNDRVTASVTLRNLFDVQWLDPGFRTADGTLYSTVLEQPGRTGLFKIGVTF
jgi:outer membrane receptor protein involved in Fe transport